MNVKLKRKIPAKDRPLWSSWVFILPVLGLVGLFLTGRQLLPHLAAAYWKEQLVEAPAEQVDVILGQMAGLDEAGIAQLVEVLGCERDAVATAAKRCLLDQLERWKSMPEPSRSSRLKVLAECLAEQSPKFGVTARGDAAELATQLLLFPSEDEGSSFRSRLIAACDEVIQAATAVHGGLTLPRSVSASTARQDEEQPVSRAVVLERWDVKDSAAKATLFDPLPGGGLPLRTVEPSEEPKADVTLPAGNGEMPPAFFQEPSGSRLLDFSNRTTNPLQIPEMPSLQKAQRTAASEDAPPARSLAHEEHEEPKTSAVEPPADLRTCEPWDLMRQLAVTDQCLAEEIRIELRRRGFSDQEIGLAGRLFDPDPAERKRLVAELPSMAEIDTSAWLLQCGKDPDAEVRLAAFSLLATSSNRLLLQKVKIRIENDADGRIRRLAEQIQDRRKR